ncbi:hypothetical protein L1987_10686 [Smallanthus sonchifolius]|uniref:Uncharacterized protein n=1 Tax=Smallanthus sonchifolius TaxID=185202 RepID=A0ACB9JB18_9ASTR|nr:hypothetical protein L1987_10686 [Smallanthus sonchifolius]
MLVLSIMLSISFWCNYYYVFGECPFGKTNEMGVLTFVKNRNWGLILILILFSVAICYESRESSTTTSPRPSFARFFRQLLSPTRKSPTSFSAPVSPGSDDIHQVFNYFDENGDGKISATELQNRLRKVGGEELQLSDEEAEMAVRSSDADGDGMLGLEDFAKMMKEGEEEELRVAFVMYSSKEGGVNVITPKSLRKMMRRLGQSATVDDCKAMIGRFDVNRDGVLDFEEFRAMMS